MLAPIKLPTDASERPVEAGQKERRGHKLIWHLLLFGASLFVPTLLLAGFLSWRAVRQEQARIEREVRTVAVNIAGALDRELRAKREMLSALATAPSLANRDYASFHRQLSALPNGDGLTLVLRDVTGQQLVSPRFLGRGAAGKPARYRRAGDRDQTTGRQ